MDDEIVQNLVKYRIEQAKENLEEAEMLCKGHKFKGASNRAYYAIFHAIKSILAIEQVDFKKHSSVIAYFNKEYVNKGTFSRELGKRISEARFFREKSDYVDFYMITKQECEKQIETADLLIKKCENYIKERKFK